MALAGCAGLGGGPACPDLGGTYADRADATGQRLSALLLAGDAGATPARDVSMTQDGERLVVAAGARHATLQRGADYVCDAQGLRLVKPQQSGLDLGEMLVHEVDTFHTFSKAPDGTLQADVSTKEHAVVAGVPLAGREHRTGALRWRHVPAHGGR